MKLNQDLLSILQLIHSMKQGSQRIASLPATSILVLLIKLLCNLIDNHQVGSVSIADSNALRNHMHTLTSAKPPHLFSTSASAPLHYAYA